MIKMHKHRYQHMRVLLIILMLCVFSFSVAFSKQGHAISIIRDAEIEYVLKQYATPIFEQAGIPKDNVNLIIIDSPDLNAFVSGGMNMFFYSGLILETETVSELVGVIAHETSHIASGHIVRMSAAIEHASIQTVFSTLLGIAAALGTGNSQIGTAIALGGQSAATSNFLHHTRTQESSADHGGLNYLKQARLSATGFLSFMKKLESEELLPPSQQSAYMRTHPLTRDRVLFLENAVEKSPFSDTPYPRTWEESHLRIKAKLLGFLHPERAMQLKDNGSIHRQYAKAIAYYRKDDPEQAISMLDNLIKKEPHNPYFYELKAQIFFENGQITKAIEFYRKSVEILPHSGLIQISLAHALLEEQNKTKQNTESAIKHLKIAQTYEKRNSYMHRLFATAYGRLGNDVYARLHLAEEAWLQNKFSIAHRQAEHASQIAEKNSPAFIRAHDLLEQIRLKRKKK